MRKLALRAATLALLVGGAGPALTSPAMTTSSPRPVPSSQNLLDGAGHGGLPFEPQLASLSCPVERGPVKEGSDANRYKVSTTVYPASVYGLRSWAKPSSYPRNNRIAPHELHIYAVTALLKQYKVESDGDIHLVIKDSAGRSMIAEIAYGSCVPTTSRWKSAIAAARSAFGAHYRATTSWHYVNRSVTLKGIPMFDVLHGQAGVAPNGIELHPVIGVTFH